MSHAEETGPPSAADAERARTLHDYALDFPETALEHPWGHDAYKVNGKIFLFLDCDANGLRLTVKLPDSGFEALLLPFTKPTGYGMGKHGWVTASFVAGAKPPMGLLHAWVLESYRAIAPKRALKVLDGAPTSAPKPTTRKRTTKKATATRAQAATKTTKTKRTPR